MAYVNPYIFFEVDYIYKKWYDYDEEKNKYEFSKSFINKFERYLITNKLDGLTKEERVFIEEFMQESEEEVYTEFNQNLGSL